MVLSTFFNDFKVAAGAGSMFYLLPVILFCQFAVSENFLIYLFFWLPNVPASTIWTKLIVDIPDLGVFKVDHIPISVCWIALVLDIFLWFAAYLYLDTVIANTFGIAKPWNFCF